MQLGQLSGSAVIPLQCSGKYIALHPVPLLIHVDGHFWSEVHLIEVFKKCLVVLGQPSWDFRSNCFRFD